MKGQNSITTNENYEDTSPQLFQGINSNYTSMAMMIVCHCSLETLQFTGGAAANRLRSIKEIRILLHMTIQEPSLN